MEIRIDYPSGDYAIHDFCSTDPVKQDAELFNLLEGLSESVANGVTPGPAKVTCGNRTFIVAGNAPATVVLTGTQRSRSWKTKLLAIAGYLGA